MQAVAQSAQTFHQQRVDARKAFEAQRKAAKKAFKAQEKAARQAFHQLHPNPTDAELKAFHDQQKAATEGLPRLAGRCAEDVPRPAVGCEQGVPHAAGGGQEGLLTVTIRASGPHQRGPFARCRPARPSARSRRSGTFQTASTTIAPFIFDVPCSRSVNAIGTSTTRKPARRTR